MLFFYVRHGDPIYQPDSLTPLGKRQAEALARRFSVYGLDRIYASSSTRAMETAQPTCEILKQDMTVLDWCHESLAGKDFYLHEDGRHDWCFQLPRYRALFRDPEVLRLGKQWYRHPAFAHTTFAAGAERVAREADAFFASLGFVHEPEQNAYRVTEPCAERVALFAHQGFGLLFLSLVLDIPYPVFSTHFDMTHTGMTVLEFPEKEALSVPKILTLSDTGHLYKEDLMMGYQNRLRF